LSLKKCFSNCPERQIGGNGKLEVVDKKKGEEERIDWLNGLHQVLVAVVVDAKSCCFYKSLPLIPKQSIPHVPSR